MTIKPNWHPSRKDLRVFGAAALTAAVVIAAMLHFRHGLAAPWLAAIVGFGAAVFLSSLLLPNLTRFVYVAMMALALPIGITLSFIVLAVLYYVILTPLGLFFRLIGRDPLDRKFTLSAESYWVRRRPPESLKRYFNQF